MTKFDYNKIASEYDKWYETPLGKQIDIWEKELFLQHLKKLRSKNILEIGAGTGHWTQWLSEQGFNITAIDIAEKMLDVAKSKNIQNAEFLFNSAEQLPFENESVDNIVAVTSLEFFEDQEKALKEIFRVVKPGGYFLVGALNKNGSLEKTRENDEIFKSTQIFTQKTLFQQLERFGNAVVDGCVYMPDLSASIDDIVKTEKRAPIYLVNIYGNFLVGSVQKQNKAWK